MTVTINGNGTITPTSAIQPTGSILQIVQSVKTSVFRTSSTTWVDITDLTGTITPSSTSSKIMVTGNFILGTTNGGYFHFRILRGTTAIDIGAADGNKTQATYSSFANAYGSQYNFSYTPMYLDSPSTTSATTYKCQLKVPWSGYGAVINSTYSDTDSDFFSTYQSNFTLIEVAG